MVMKFNRAKKSQAKLRLGLIGPSGSGKTYTALSLASGLGKKIAVVDTEGLGVLNAYAGDKISAEKVIKTLQELKVADKVKHRKLIIPGLLPIFRAEIEDASEWKEVIIGPEYAREIPAFLQALK